MTEKQVEELIRKYAQGLATEMEIRQLSNWYRSSSPADVEWLSEHVNEEQQVYHRMLQRLHQEMAPKRTKGLRFSRLKVAAVFLLIMGAGMIGLWYKNTDARLYMTVSNPTGKIQLVHLPDSSQVWLNAASTLRYRKEFKEDRKINLQGEAYFNVTHDAIHPFSVATGDLLTSVLGTSFNIKAYPEENSTTVSVVSGQVQVKTTAKELAALTPSMQLYFDRQKNTAQTINIDTATMAAWRQGILMFDGKTFAEIALTLERWYGVQIVFSDPGMRSCRYYMSFNNNTPLEKVLSTMAQITGMKYSINQQSATITLSGKSCT